MVHSSALAALSPESLELEAALTELAVQLHVQLEDAVGNGGGSRDLQHHIGVLGDGPVFRSGHLRTRAYPEPCAPTPWAPLPAPPQGCGLMQVPKEPSGKEEPAHRDEGFQPCWPGDVHTSPRQWPT